MSETSKKPQDTLDEHLAKLGYPPTVVGNPNTAQVVVGTPPTRPSSKPNSQGVPPGGRTTMSDLSKRPDESLEDLLERLAMPTEHGDPNTATVFIGGDPPVKRPSKPNSQGSSGS